MRIRKRLKKPKVKIPVYRNQRLHILNRGRRKFKTKPVKKPLGVRRLYDKQRENHPFIKYKKRIVINWEAAALAITFLLLLGAAVLLIWYYFNNPV